ncbi:hypothetical protein HPP92_019046 [Vanilla planifolia]|uniref:Uncharacterized protein n=1 Tax=Vanilla planifolia TaxID=51239 RepID=A0A835Q8S7_VANPL|nr:hypothetical protein HPP92_019046 [Vanilla planifolia]
MEDIVKKTLSLYKRSLDRRCSNVQVSWRVEKNGVGEAIGERVAVLGNHDEFDSKIGLMVNLVVGKVECSNSDRDWEIVQTREMLLHDLQNRNKPNNDDPAACLVSSKEEQQPQPTYLVEVETQDEEDYEDGCLKMKPGKLLAQAEVLFLWEMKKMFPSVIWRKKTTREKVEISKATDSQANQSSGRVQLKHRDSND